MNDIYLSVRPIREHYKKCGKEWRTEGFIEEFLDVYDACYCFHVHKIVLNTKIILRDKVNINQVIDHEVMHYILQKYIGMEACYKWDNIYHKHILHYIWENGSYDR